MSTELSDAVAHLTTELPTSRGALTVEHLDAVIEMKDRIRDAYEDSRAHTESMLNLVTGRGCTDGPVADYITADERVAWEQSERRALDAERAQDALETWERRSGFRGQTATSGPMIVESPDGELTYRFGK